MNLATHLAQSVGRAVIRAAGSSDERVDLHHHGCRRPRAVKMYQLTDRLHTEHTALVSGNEIAATVSAWLAELDAASPLVDDLAAAVQVGDWPATYTLAEKLSVEVSVTTQPVSCE